MPHLLVVQHEDRCPPGWVGDWLGEEGIGLDVRRPYAGEPLPADLRGHAGLVILGGPMGANDDDAYGWLSPTKDLIREGAAAGVPVLGICLGHQLAAVALGGAVERNPAGKRRGVLELGWLPAAEDEALVRACGRRGVQWHQDVVTRLPEGAVPLARAATGELLAARFAPTVWGVQSHPEADRTIVGGWAATDRQLADSEEERTAVDTALADVHLATEELREGWRPLVAAFAEQVRVCAGAAAAAR